MDVTFLAGRPLKVNGNEYEPGDEVPQVDLDTIPAIESYVSAGYLYRVVDEEGYNKLPPHLFHTVQTRRELEAQLENDRSFEEPVEEAQAVGEASDETQLANRQAELAVEHAEARKRRGVVLTEAEKAAAVDASGTKAAPKKTAAKKEN